MTSPPASPNPPLKNQKSHLDQDTAYYGHIAVPGDDQVDYVHEANLHPETHVEARGGALAPVTGQPTAPRAAAGQKSRAQALQDLRAGRLNAHARARVDAKADTMLRRHR
jgi:hypothetical protein